MLTKVIDILSRMIGAEEGELEADLDLFENGLLDSFAVVQLVVELEEAFGVTLAVENISREDIATPALIARQVELAQ